MAQNILNIIVLFGGIQGLTLCFFLYSRRNINTKAFVAFVLFLFNLSIFNIDYALIFSQIYQIGSFPLAAFPLPYKYLIGVGFLLYVRAYIAPPQSKYLIKPIYLFLPAIIYGIVRLYWSFLILMGINTNVIREVYDTGFFTLNELFYLMFDLFLIGLAFQLLRQQKKNSSVAIQKGKQWHWLNRFVLFFLCYTSCHLLFQIISLTLNTQDLRLFYYPTLILNSAFIYWIGFIGYTQPNVILYRPLLKQKQTLSKALSNIEAKLKEAITVQEVYKNARLTVAELGKQIDVAPNDITRYLNDHLNMNFSQYLNYHRTQKVISLLQSDLAHQYTLVALAKEAGFSSKSSFNKVFKEQTGKTPSAYKKALNQ